MNATLVVSMRSANGMAPTAVGMALTSRVVLARAPRIIAKTVMVDPRTTTVSAMRIASVRHAATMAPIATVVLQSVLSPLGTRGVARQCGVATMNATLVVSMRNAIGMAGIAAILMTAVVLLRALRNVA
jgi:hypothetical protein